MDKLPRKSRRAQEIRYQLLSEEPQIELVEPPVLDSGEAETLGIFQQYLEETPGAWDGPMLQVAAVEPGKILAFPASYAWSLAVHNGFLEQYSLGQISVLLAIYGPEGLLWQRRSGRVLWGDRWDFSAAGGVDKSGQGAAREAILREAWEEIGAAESDLLGLRPMMLAWGQGRDQAPEGQLLHRPIDGALIVWAARIREGWKPQLGPEVSEVRWKSPLETPGWVINQVGLLVPTLASILRQESS
jgi:8-oxo-dGTP pyrophosphatase MutT (NUDIX family)